MSILSSNVLSLEHDGTTMEVRFHCYCTKHGFSGCSKCGGKGYTIYRGEVPEAVFQAVRDDPESVGGAYNRLVVKARGFDGSPLFVMKKA